MSLSVEVRSISKSFGLVEVLHGVSFSLQPGSVVGLLGENGAGKSTLVKILSGYEQATQGDFTIDGVTQCFANSREAEHQGLVLIHQEFNLAEQLTIAQNIFLGHERMNGWILDDRSMNAAALEAMKKVGMDADPETKVRDLIVAEKQLVEIAKAVSRNARLLIMDEPTATLTPTETEKLFVLIGQLKARGVTIIYISHKLDEVERVTDEIIVMRDGAFVARALTANTKRQQMANLMVGRDVSDMYPPKEIPTFAAPLLKVSGLTVPGWAENVSFEVRPGEILGFAGLVGAGRTELFEGLLGLRPRSAGEIEIAGQMVDLRSPRNGIRNGIAYLSEDRKGKALHVDLGLRENLTLLSLDRYARPLLDSKAEHRALQEKVDEFGIRTGDLDIRAVSLSGGNQQKLALAKFLHPDPKVIVLDEPTRGVDVGAKRDIYFLIHRLACEGRGVIVVSSELVELIGLCHRVIVMRSGSIQATLTADQLTEEELIAYATGTH
ncbi:MAG: sugar ABC transporter ATP-binding protein [Comamonadaceae bacterium]|nr:sugar ABC transporter ATP-binding protein [Comamonadaceae bacterium]